MWLGQKGPCAGSGRVVLVVRVWILNLLFVTSTFSSRLSAWDRCIVSSRGDHPLEIWATKAGKVVKRQRKDFLGAQGVRGTHR